MNAFKQEPESSHGDNSPLTFVSTREVNLLRLLFIHCPVGF